MHTPLNGAQQKCFQSGLALAKAGPVCAYYFAVVTRYFDYFKMSSSFLRV